MTLLLLPKQLDQSLEKILGNKTAVQEKVATAIRLSMYSSSGEKRKKIPIEQIQSHLTF